jgi:D-alanyl-D-alanine dipeptidase
MSDINLLPQNWNIPLDKCFSYSQLASVPVVESGEKLVDLNEIENLNFKVGPTPLKLREYVKSGMWIRQSVAEKLIQAQNFLSTLLPNAQLYVLYAYRHPEIQKNYFEDFYAKSKIKFPEMSEQELLEYVHHYMAIPGVGGHPVGGAVDISMVDSISAEFIDMGSKIADFSDMSKVPPITSSISAEFQQKRIILREVMMKAGFAPYDFEWWHFSYGDREWACYYNKPNAIYGEINFIKI